MDNLQYEKIDIQPYLRSTTIYPNLAKNIFKWRTRMVNFKSNFKNGNINISCPLGCLEEDRQEFIFKCPVILDKLPDIQTSGVKYSDIFSGSVSKIKVTGELLQKAFQVRTNLIEKKSNSEEV